MSLFFAVEWMWVCVICLSYIQYWVVWLHSEGSFVDLSKLSVVISVYWACEVSGTWLLIAVICSIPAASSSHWPTISFILSIHKSYFMTVRSFSTNYTCSCLDKEGKDRKYVVGWRRGCFCDTLSGCIWFRCYGNYLLLQVFVRRFLKTSSVVAKLRQKSAVKKGIVSFIQTIVAVVALWSSVINDLPTASVFVCQAVPRGPWNCWTLYFSAGKTGPRSIKVRPVTWTMTLYMQWMCFLVLQSLRVILPEVRLGMCQYLCKGHSMCYAWSTTMRPWVGKWGKHTIFRPSK